ncbi:MAG: type II secretion system F family protein, partial [Planctomycetes bacterium]|nr:type II secretion system F family protein [Planctomycetota bacterium]
IALVSIFVLLLSGWTICVLLWMVQYARRRQRIKRRLGFEMDEETRKAETMQLWREEVQARRAGAVKQKKETLGERLERLRADAGWKRPAPVVLSSVGTLAALTCLLAILADYGWMIGVLAAVGILVVFRILTAQRINHRINLFDRQLVESLGIAARALRAGHPLVGAFQAISEEIGEPVGTLFGEICQEQALGLDLRDSIRRVADTTRNTDLKLFATAVNIQMTSGGNLADVMDSLSAVMRQRMRLNRKIRVLTASTKLNRNTLLAVPVLLFAALNVIAPEFVSVMYTTTLGRILLLATVAGMLFGAWVMAKLSVLKY